ncbi:hypothetical protein BWI15_32045 [Kribbella sp. ALI-6-A]|uniref:hypothetical protein n=1 Tax=Kribbella sp. ALI-6-A TaxID=1933817 RepID=UPI00097C7707|nr:hypothetical protein [Kribbella sp. ALI-6-A]ONI67726.1 hypothetical protein BWI15_32045 [Kribbella sp. ALI-6-A]
MTSKDLKDLLGAVADEGRETVALDEQRVAGRIKGRRRRNAVVMGAASVGTAAVIALAAVAVVPNLGGEDTPVAGSRQATGLTLGSCGETAGGEPRTDTPIELSAAPGVRPVSGRPDLATVEVRLTNRTDTVLKDLVTSERPEVSVAQDGKVVATPLPSRSMGVRVTLQPGETKTLITTIGLRRCTQAAAQTGDKLAPGSYQLYATQSFSPTDGGPEPAIEAQGGPWTVELK